MEFRTLRIVSNLGTLRIEGTIGCMDRSDNFVGCCLAVDGMASMQARRQISSLMKNLRSKLYNHSGHMGLPFKQGFGERPITGRQAKGISGQ